MLDRPFFKPFRRGPAATLEPEVAGELQRAHPDPLLPPHARPVICPTLEAWDVVVRVADVRVVEDVSRVHAKPEGDSLRELELFPSREVQLDEMRSNQRIDRIIAVGVGLPGAGMGRKCNLHWDNPGSIGCGSGSLDTRFRFLYPGDCWDLCWV